MAREDAHFRLRLPHDVKAWLAGEAKREIRSITAQIVFVLRKEMAAGEDFGEDAPAAGRESKTPHHSELEA